MIVIVPDTLRNAIDAKLDESFKTCPEAKRDREYLFNELLEYFDKHGVIPGFSITSNA